MVELALEVHVGGVERRWEQELLSWMLHLVTMSGLAESGGDQVLVLKRNIS